MKKYLYKLSDALSPQRIAALLNIVLFVSLLPIAYLSLFVRATGDDLGYSADLHHVMENGGSLTDALHVIASRISTSYHLFQGTWSSIFLFQLQPGIWGDRFYTLTVWIALLLLLGGTFYFLWTLLIEHQGQRRVLFWILYPALVFFMIQFMPKVRGGLFWYTSVAHYCVPYGVCMLCMGWSIRFLDTRKRRYYVGMLAGMSYLGGAGYPEVVLAAVWFFFVILYTIAEPAFKLRHTVLMSVPLLLEMTGFAISALAPGNKVRGGEGFGFSISNVIGTLIEAFRQGITESAGYFLYARPLFLLPLLIAVFTWELYDPQRNKNRIRYPLAALLACYSIVSLVRAPEIYAAVSVSGGVPDTEYFTFVLMMSLGVYTAVAWRKQRREEKLLGGADSPAGKDDGDRKKFAGYIRTPFVVFCVLFCVVFSKHLIGTSVDYTCMKFITTGALADYRSQMQEWLDILEDDSITDAKLPAMNSEQGPYMIMVPLETDTAFSNYAYETYYSKNSVVCVPRE